MRWGPRIVEGGVRFALWAPDARGVAVEIGGGAGAAMVAGADGWFAVTLPVGVGARYRFRIDGGPAVPDPASRRQDGGVHGWSVVVDTTPQPSDWRGRPWHETVLVELHVGVLGGFAGVMARLRELAAAGVTAIELMPIGAFAGDRGWGYDGVLPYAVHEAYGTPESLRALIDAAHASGLSVILDVVYNHFGPDGNYLGAYASAFFDTARPTPWGGAVAVREPAVARFFVDNALMWLCDYGFDGLRLDAVHAIGDSAFLDAMAAEIRAALPGRHVHLMLENEHNDAARLGDARYDAQWNDDIHNVVHVLLTGETSGYYADFAEAPTGRLARCLAQGFIYQGDASPRGFARGTPSAHLPPTAFVAFLQNHDQVGNRALGERLVSLVAPDRLRAAIALLLLCPQVPMLFMGDLEGSASPFLFFTDFADELADAVRDGRRREFASFPAFADPAARAAIPDPNDPATFEASRPVAGDPGWGALYRALIAVRHAVIVPGLVGASSLDATADRTQVTARWRLGDGRVLGVAIDLGEVPAPLPPVEALWREGERFVAWIAA